MPYTAITDEEKVKQAFEDLWSKFKEGAQENGIYSGAHCYYHRNKNDLWGALGKHSNDADFIAFGRGEFGSAGERPPVFEMNYRAGRDGGQDKGVFVQDDEGNRYLTHSGNLRISGKQNVRDQLMNFTGNVFWIDVERNNHKRLLITPLDSDDPPKLIEQINQVTKEIENFKNENFKKGGADYPTTLVCWRTNRLKNIQMVA